MTNYRIALFCVVTLSMKYCQGFSTTPFGTKRYTHPKPLFLGPSGGASIAKPKVEIGQKTAVTHKVGEKSKTSNKNRVQTDEPITRKEPNIEDAPMYKVMLLGDEEYDQAHTIQRMCEILEDMDESKAAIVFTGAQQSGKAMCGKYPLEHAELYVEQLLRSDPMIFCDLEEEDKIDKQK
eukprot:CAMPEP_0172495552 /NCGR_PEP_ID=MMETSP1066-20121228/71468_1 /TAXON_ID=671091 /ORGANISM="Coscinodiscus wailesii, Strain CCMP2513" /LENGTH=178 /DNA_ID=CAMNT_0013267297 /DNA_START=149 /DNA_END=685 /DNA_ORIENTATION=-